MTAAPESSPAHSLTLKIPGQAQYIGIARLAVSGLANQLDIPYDEAEDLKLAVTEACSHILKNSNMAVQLHVACQFNEGTLRIEVKSAPTPHIEIDAVGAASVEEPFGNGDAELGLQLVEALMDSVEMETDEATGAIAVLMERRLPTGGASEG